MRTCLRIELQIDPGRIHFLKFILEGYDNLALLSTRDRRTGLVEVITTHEQEEETRLLLQDLHPALVTQ